MTVIDELYKLAEKLGGEVKVEKVSDTELEYTYGIGTPTDLYFSVDYAIAPPEDPKKGPEWEITGIGTLREPFDPTFEDPYYKEDLHYREFKHDSLVSYFKKLKEERERLLESLSEHPDLAGSEFFVTVEESDPEWLQKLIDYIEE